MRFLSTKLSVLLLLTFLTFGLSTKAQTIVPASQLSTSTSDIPSTNLTASLIVDRAQTISLYSLYCAASTDCDKKCKGDQRYKCDQEQHSCFGEKVVYTVGCVLAGAAAAGPVGGLIGGTVCGAFGGNSCRKKKKACLSDSNWLYSCINNCQQAKKKKPKDKLPTKDFFLLPGGY